MPILSNGVIFTRSLADPWDKVHSRDPDASNGQGMFPWLQQTLVWAEGCVTNQNKTKQQTKQQNSIDYKYK